MFFITKVVIVSLISAIGCFSQTAYEAATKNRHQIITDQSVSEKTGLLKSSNSTMTSYTNSTFNFQYTAPTGWSFNAPTVYSDGVTITATNPLYSANVFIYVFDRLTSVGAKDFAKSTCFETIYIAYKNTAITEPAPLIYFAADTFDTEFNYGQAWTTVRFGTNSNLIINEYSTYNSRFVIEVQYVTTYSDHSLNTNNYFQNVLNSKFVTLTPSLSKNSTIEPRSKISLTKSGSNDIKIHSDYQRNIALTMYDLSGRKIGNLYSGPTIESISLPKSASNSYLVQLKADKEKCSINSTMIK